MKEENEKRSTIRTIEYSAILIFFLIIIIILVPSVSKIVYNMSKDSATTSTQGMIDTVKSYYVDINLLNEVGLPFKVVFDEDGYTFYENGKEVEYESRLNIEITGKTPTSGSIQINTDGTVTVTDLTFGNFTCNQTDSSDIICDNTW